MASYYVNTNAQPNGDHEVHSEGCYWMPSAGNRQHLGEFSSCWGAVAESRKYYARSNGCAHCSPSCHTG
jgi:hypothetical protein